MAITKILNIQESDGRNPASHLKNALEYIQNPDKTEECVLVGGINCLPDTAFEQMEETKNIFHKTGKRQGYHVIISFSPEEKVTAEQAMYVLEHFAKDVLGDDYEAVYAVHTDREHMHLIWNSVSMTTGKKYNSPKSNWKNLDCQHFFRQIFLGYFPDIVQAFDTLGVTDLMNCHRFAYMNCHQIDWFSVISQPHRAAA